jgi:tricorn protease
MRASLLLLSVLALAGVASAREAKLVRYPHYHGGKVAFSYLGDVWTASESGQNVQRITANSARDVYPRFSPDGKWIAFSSDRSGNLDVYLAPSTGGQPKQITWHSADDNVLGWSPDSRTVLFSSQRGEDFMPKLYIVPVDGGMDGAQDPTWACGAASPPMARSSPSIAGRRSIGASITGAPTSRT